MPNPTTKANPANPVAPGVDRLGRALGADPIIDPDGGRFGAGIIRRVSLASVGEALGHYMWLDQETLSQIVKFANANEGTGLKSRFTHPGMSSDGMGRHLGRLHNVSLQGEKVLGDLHFAKSAHQTPDGDLAEYVMELTREDSEAAGLSIVFHHDWDAEDEFEEANQEEYEYTNSRGKTETRSRFKSPDSRNENNYQHVRIRELRAADVVDEPAANPTGMFDRVGLPREADELLSYAAGLSETKPATSSFGVDGDRASQFLARWLESHGLSLTPKESPTVATETTPAVDPAPVQTDLGTPEQPTREAFTAELNKFTAKFGAENGAKWFGENKTFSEALELHVDALSAQVNSEKERADQAEERLSSLSLGETTPVETGTTDTDAKKVTFAQATKRKS